MRRRLLGCLMMAALVSGCAPARVQSAGPVETGPLAAPGLVMVYPFSIVPQAVRLDQGVQARLQRGTDPSAIAAAQARAAADAQSALQATLIADLRAKGLPAVAAQGAPPPHGVALLVQGRILSLNEGNRTRRLVVGLGAGQSRLSADAQMLYAGPGQQPRRLQNFTVEADSGRMPGGAETLGVGVAAGTAATAAAASAGMHAANEHRSTDDEALANKAAHGLAAQIGDYAAAQSWIAAHS